MEESLSEEQLSDVRRIVVAYDRIGFLLLQDFNTLKLFYEFQSDEIISLRNKLEPRILDIRIARNNPKYCYHFEKLAAKVQLLSG